MPDRGSTPAPFIAFAPSVSTSISGEPVTGGSTYVRLDAYADFEAYAAARPETLASQVRRKLHRLQSDGRCEFHIYGTGERDAALASVHELEEGGLSGYPESVLPSGDLNTIVARGFDSGLVRCSVLKIDGRTASWRLTIGWAGRSTWPNAPSIRHSPGTRRGSCTAG